MYVTLWLMVMLMDKEKKVADDGTKWHEIKVLFFYIFKSHAIHNIELYLAVK